VSAPTATADRIADAFAGHGKRAALMPYLMGGHTGLDGSRAAAVAAASAGADLLELGVPFSDPLADGPTIHEAGTRALAAGVTPDDVLSICADVADRLPVLLMVYANIVLSVGGATYARRAADAGAAGLIVPDLPHDEAGELREACDVARLALIPLVAPTTTAERLAAIGSDARGFVYTVSLVGTTGERSQLPPELPAMIERVRATTTLPVAVGFGIATPAHARAVGEVADGVIVGTRVVRAAQEGGAQAVGALVRELAQALRRA